MCPNKEKILKPKKINGRSVSVIYDCFQTVLYGRFETVNIWLNKTGCVLLEVYMDVPKRLHMSVSTLTYVDVPTHLHTFVLERRGRSETPSDNCFYTPRIWPRHISSDGGPGGPRWSNYAPMAWMKWVEKKDGCHWRF